MVSMYMIDTNSMGIPGIYEIQKKRSFPLPSYDLDVPNRVRVTIYGKVLNKNYTKLLHSNRDMDLRTAFLLDQIQKQRTITKEDYKMLKKNGLADGRYPHLFVSYRVAEAFGDKAAYVRNKGLDEKVVKELIAEALKHGPLRRLDIYKKYKKLSNLLQDMRQEGIIDVSGNGVYSKWCLKDA